MYKQGILTKIQSELRKVYGEPSPYWEEWKRGRPSKEALAKREKHYEWLKEQGNPAIGFLQSLSETSKIQTSGKGKVRIRYIQRGTNV